MEGMGQCKSTTHPRVSTSIRESITIFKVVYAYLAVNYYSFNSTFIGKNHVHQYYAAFSNPVYVILNANGSSKCL